MTIVSTILWGMPNGLAKVLAIVDDAERSDVIGEHPSDAADRDDINAIHVKYMLC